MKRAEEMRACFSAFLVAHAIFAHCVIVNVNKGSQIIADTKEELSPLIIDSKLNEIITIYLPIVKGTKARYYLTNPRGEERKLHIKRKERKKRIIHIEGHDNSSLSYTFNNNVKNLKPTKDIKIRVSDIKVERTYNDSAEEFKQYYIYNAKQTKEDTVIKDDLNLNSINSDNHLRDNTIDEDTFHRKYNIHYDKSRRYKQKLMELNDYTTLTPHKNTVQQSESQLNNSFIPDLTQHKQKANLKNMNVRTVNFSKENDLIQENTDNFLNKAVFKESKSKQSTKYSELTKIESRKSEEYLTDSKTNRNVKVILNEIVEVSNLTEYDDDVFGKKRKSSANFNLGPLTEEDHGNWVLSVFYKNRSSWVELYQVITIHIFESIPAVPKATRLEQGANYILSFSYPIEHLQSCQLVSPKAASEKYYERYGLHPEYCGYIVKNISKTEEGTWCIVGVGKIVYEACSHLQVGTGEL